MELEQVALASRSPKQKSCRHSQGSHSPGEPAEPLHRERVVSNFPGSALSRAIEVPGGRHVPGKGSQGWSSPRVSQTIHTSHSPDAQCGSAQRSYTRHHPEESILYNVIQQELGAFMARAQVREQPVPRFVEQEFHAFLRCGILAHGFLRLHCDDCGFDRLVPFSCERRGFCPSCGGHRMAER